MGVAGRKARDSLQGTSIGGSDWRLPNEMLFSASGLGLRHVDRYILKLTWPGNSESTSEWWRVLYQPRTGEVVTFALSGVVVRDDHRSGALRQHRCHLVPLRRVEPATGIVHDGREGSGRDIERRCMSVVRDHVQRWFVGSYNLNRMCQLIGREVARIAAFSARSIAMMTTSAPANSAAPTVNATV